MLKPSDVHAKRTSVCPAQNRLGYRNTLSACTAALTAQQFKYQAGEQTSVVDLWLRRSTTGSRDTSKSTSRLQEPCNHTAVMQNMNNSRVANAACTATNNERCHKCSLHTQNTDGHGISNSRAANAAYIQKESQPVTIAHDMLYMKRALHCLEVECMLTI